MFGDWEGLPKKTGSTGKGKVNIIGIGAGFNYYLDGQKLKFTGEYMSVDFDQDHPTDVSLRDYNQATLGFQMIF